MNLFEIDEKIKNCFKISDTEVVDGETGEVFDEAYVADLEMQIDEKIENIAKYVKNLDSDIEQLKKQKDLFAQRQKQTENKRNALKKYLNDFLDGEKWSAEDKSVTITFRKSEQVNIIDENNIPSDYLVEQLPKINKAEIKKAIKNGKQVTGAELVTNNNIQIK